MFPLPSVVPAPSFCSLAGPLEREAPLDFLAGSHAGFLPLLADHLSDLRGW